MNEIADTRTRHLNPATLAAETPSLDEGGNGSSTQIDALLTEIAQ